MVVFVTNFAVVSGFSFSETVHSDNLGLLKRPRFLLPLFELRALRDSGWSSTVAQLFDVSAHLIDFRNRLF